MLKKHLLRFVAVFTLLLAALASALPFDRAGLFGMRYGPNFSWTTMGNSPIIFGEWLPQASTSLDLNWLEPLSDNLSYGTPLDLDAAFLRMLASVEISPFYETFSLGLGIRPFHMNPQVELQFTYENLLYFNTNVEMALTNNETEEKIAKTWNADYVLDNLYDGSRWVFDYMQTFSIGANIDYISASGWLIGLHFNYVLIDIRTNYDGKSYDFRRNMPVFSRDFILELSCYEHISFTPNWSAFGQVDFYRSGLSKKGSSITKEPLSYLKVFLGPEFSFNEGRDRLTISPGYFFRTQKKHYDGSIAEQWIVQIQYQHRFKVWTLFNKEP